MLISYGHQRKNASSPGGLGASGRNETRLRHTACTTPLEYLDANYGGVLLVFDRLFGTCSAERDDIAIHCGLVRPVRGFKPLSLEFVEWRKLARDL